VFSVGGQNRILSKIRRPYLENQARNRMDKPVQNRHSQAGLEGIRFHNLRHIFVSLMLLRGAKPKVISEAPGHASVAFTMDTHSHIIEGMQSDAMELLDEVLPAGVSRENSVKLLRFSHRAPVAQVDRAAVS